MASMTDANNTATIQLDEDILSDTVSDEALEAAAGTGRGIASPYGIMWSDAFDGWGC
jgi:hypothetical protein